MGGFYVSIGAPITISDTNYYETVTRNKLVENKNIYHQWGKI